MKHLSHHLIGDTKYGRGEHNKLFREVFGCHRMLLHALRLKIIHPMTNQEITFEAPLDDTFQSIFTSFGWQKLIF